MDDYLRGQFEDLLRTYNSDKKSISKSIEILSNIVEEQQKQIKDLREVVQDISNFMTKFD